MASSLKLPQPPPPDRDRKQSEELWRLIRKKRRNGRIFWSFLAVVITLLFIRFNPSAQYTAASIRDSIPAYEAFLARFPNSTKAESAKERIWELAEESVWQAAAGKADHRTLKRYIRTYPDGYYLRKAEAELAMLAEQQWEAASAKESAAPLREILRRYPDSLQAASAKTKLVEIIDQKWIAVAQSNSASEIRAFLVENPETSMGSEIAARLIALADRKWEQIADSLSIPELQMFLEDYPESSKSGEVEARIRGLPNNITWVREQGRLSTYIDFVAANPNHPDVAEIERRIIDLEVESIASGKHSPTPKPQTLLLGGSDTVMEISNLTTYELTVRYSGSDSQKLVIAAGGTSRMNILPGDYKVAASVTTATIQNYYGTQKLRGGRYGSSYYISSETRIPKLGLPNIRP